MSEDARQRVLPLLQGSDLIHRCGGPPSPKGEGRAVCFRSPRLEFIVQYVSIVFTINENTLDSHGKGKAGLRFLLPLA